MEFFHKGSDAPRPIFGSYGTNEAHLIFGQKEDEQYSPKTFKMAIIKINFLVKVPKNVHNPQFYTKIPLLLRHKKCALKLWIGSGTPLPYGRIP